MTTDVPRPDWDAQVTPAPSPTGDAHHAPAPDTGTAPTLNAGGEELLDPSQRPDPSSADMPASGAEATDMVDEPASTPAVYEVAPNEEDQEITALSAAVELLGAGLNQRLDELQKALSQSSALQEHQATMVERLHAENQTLRQGELTQALKPFILDVARLHDDVERVISNGGEALAKAAPIPEFILDVLDRHGVTQIAPSSGDSFDAKLHQGLKVVDTSDQSLDGLVETVIRPGFIRDGAHLVRPAQVVVYRYRAEEPLQPPAPVAPAVPTTVEIAPAPSTPSSDTKTTTVPTGAATTTTDNAGSEDVG